MSRRARYTLDTAAVVADSRTELLRRMWRERGKKEVSQLVHTDPQLDAR